MKGITMLLSNEFRPDPRVQREAEALADSGYRVRIVSWDREGKSQAQQNYRNYSVERIQNVPTRYGAGWRQIMRIPKFWLEAVQRARSASTDALHCHDLDTLPAGWWLKRKTGMPLIFDAHEDYPALMSLYLPGFMVRGLRVLERRLLRQADYIIAASQEYADKVTKLGVKNVITIGNVQPLEPYDAVTSKQIQSVRLELGLKPGDLAIAYIGGFSRNRLLLPLVEAARLSPEVKFFFWGDGHQRPEVEAGVKDIPNARYLGWLPAQQVPLMMRAMDGIYYCLKPDYPGAKYNASNTLSSAMAAGKPVIANNVGDLGRTVLMCKCGILLETVTPESICEAVQSLQDLEYRRQLGQAGRRAAESEYNWEACKASLVSVYENLLGG
jgi:glycosyltransferase involved in cell wall biosynthesis